MAKPRETKPKCFQTGMLFEAGFHCAAQARLSEPSPTQLPAAESQWSVQCCHPALLITLHCESGRLSAPTIPQVLSPNTVHRPSVGGRHSSTSEYRSSVNGSWQGSEGKTHKEDSTGRNEREEMSLISACRKHQNCFKDSLSYQQKTSSLRLQLSSTALSSFLTL